MRLIGLLLLLLVLPLLAFAQASQPASQPAANAVWSWVQANWYWILFVVILPSVINGLKEKTVREGIIGFLASVIDRSSVTTNKDSPGTFKPPIVASKPPQK